MSVTMALGACGGSAGTRGEATGGAGSGGGTAPTSSNPPDSALAFSNITTQSRIGFVHGYLALQGTAEEGFSGGAASGDFDGDGDIDLFVVRGDIGPNLLYRNEGNGEFTDVAGAAGLAFTKSVTENFRHSGPSFADLDGDHDLDLFIGGILGDPSLVFRNNGDGTFADVTATSGLAGLTSLNTISSAFGDYDRDGDLDMFLTHWGTFRDRENPGDTEHLWRNDSTPDSITFTSVSVPAQISASIIKDAPAGMKGTNHDYTFTPTFVDINADGYPDILVVADFNTTQYFLNNRDGTFTNASEENILIDRAGMGSAVGDFDNDGDIDWFVASIYSLDINQEVGNRLYRNDNGRFIDATRGTGLIDGSWGWGSCFADFNLDGFIDLYHTNGWSDPVGTAGFSRDQSRLFISNKDGTFTNRATNAGLLDTEQGRGVVCDDFDGDGDVDIFLLHRNVDNSATLFRNDAVDVNFLSVELVGTGKNTHAVGAVVRVTAADSTQTRQVTVGSNFTSQNSTVQTFGLGANTSAASVEVTWPDGARTTLQNVTGNRRLVIAQ